MHKRTVNMSFCFICIAIASILLSCDNENPARPTENLTITGLTIDELVGTYELISFEINYTNGQSLSSTTPGVNYTGRMTISSSGDMIQDITINSNSITAISKIMSTISDSVLSLSSGGNLYEISAKYFGNQLLTFIDATQMGQNFTETDTWERISKSVANN